MRPRYFLFLLINVVFIFLVASTYWQLVRDLASSPAKGLEKLAQALNAGNARHFFVSYVILQGTYFHVAHLIPELTGVGHSFRSDALAAAQSWHSHSSDVFPYVHHPDSSR